MNFDSEYDIKTIKPNYINLLNLHSIIYNKKRENKISMVEGVNPRVPNDTSEIQEEFNSIMVDHLRLQEEDEENIVINKYYDNTDFSKNNEDNTKLYALTFSKKSICYSKSKLSLLICASNMMNDDNGYGENFNIIEL